jgi:transposase-like protein
VPPKLFQKPLTASIRERLRADKAALKAHRAAPPTAQQIASVHKLPVPVAPQEEQAEPVAKKQKTKRSFTPDYRARIVARALQAKETGSESVLAIAKAEGIRDSNIHNWVKAAKKANGATAADDTATEKPKAKADIKSVSRELSDAMQHVEALKKKLRKMLSD